MLEPQDFELLNDLHLTLKVDDEIRQTDNTANLVHKPAETLTELSSVQDLFAGDLLSTGTPSGCALAVPPPWKQKFGALVSESKKWEIFIGGQRKRRQYLRPGQVVTASIRSIDGSIDLGEQRNRVVAAEVQR